MIIDFPWPPTECRPNFIRSNHWRRWRPKGTAYRNACHYIAKEAKAHWHKWPDGDLHLTYTFIAPKGCRWDDDAKESAFKTGQDGLAEAMGVDDKHFKAKKIHVRGDGAGIVRVEIKTQPIDRK